VSPDAAEKPTYSRCRWCDAEWRTMSDADRQSLADHEGRCALRIACPRCEARPRVRCRYPSGQYAPPHSARERKARGW
jgi:hypothetical protein